MRPNYIPPRDDNAEYNEHSKPDRRNHARSAIQAVADRGSVTIAMFVGGRGMAHFRGLLTVCEETQGQRFKDGLL